MRASGCNSPGLLDRQLTIADLRRLPKNIASEFHANSKPAVAYLLAEPAMLGKVRFGEANTDGAGAKTATAGPPNSESFSIVDQKRC